MPGQESVRASQPALMKAQGIRHIAYVYIYVCVCVCVCYKYIYVHTRCARVRVCPATLDSPADEPDSFCQGKCEKGWGGGGREGGTFTIGFAATD